MKHTKGRVNRNRSCCILLAGLVLILSCGEESKQTADASTGITTNDKHSNGATAIKLELNAEGSAPAQYTYDILTTNKSSFEVNEEDKVNSSSIAMKLRYDIRQDSNSNALFKVTYDQFRMKVQADKEEKEIDAAEAASSDDPSEKILAALHGAVIQARVTPKGEVSSVTGLEELSEKMREAAGDDQAALFLLQNSIKKTFGTEYFRNTIEQQFKIFPDSPVAIGQSWTLNTNLATDIKTSIQTVYTLRKIKDGIVYIDMEGKMGSAPQEMEVEGYRTKVQLSGGQEGKIELEQQTGMPLFCETTFKAKGSVEVMGRQIPLKVESASTIRGKKL